MALPSTITGSWPSFLSGQVGPFLVSGNLYAFTVTNSLHDVSAWKSTDGGNTWAEQDSAHRPSAGAGQQDSVYVVPVGTTLYVICRGSSAFQVFAFASDAWGAGSSITNAPSPAANITGVVGPVILSVRSNGDYVVFYQSGTESLMGQARRRFSYNIYSAGAWGTAVQFGTGVKAHYDLRAAILGASDRVEFLYTISTDTNLVNKRSLSSANALDTNQTFTAANTDNYDVGIPVAFTNGGNTEIGVTYKDTGTGTKVSHARWNSGASAAVTTTVGISTKIPIVSTSNPGALAANGTTKYCFFPQSSDADIYQTNDGGTNTWAADAAQEASITCQGVNANLVSSAIGILFSDNGTVKYDQYSLSSGTTYTKAGFGKEHG